MATVKELKAELKAKGIKGFAGKKKAELEAMLAEGGGEKSPMSPKKAKTPYVAKLTKDSKTNKLMKVPKNPVIDKQISMPKEKVSMNMQEELAKAGMRGGTKKKLYS